MKFIFLEIYKGEKYKNSEIYTKHPAIIISALNEFFPIKVSSNIYSSKIVIIIPKTTIF